MLDGQLLRISTIFDHIANPWCKDTLPRGMLDLLLADAEETTSADPT
jgi:hypothetical protein